MSQANSYGYASEVKVDVIGGRHKEEALVNDLSEWLRVHGAVEILDIKYGYCAYGNGFYSAMIIYRQA